MLKITDLENELDKSELSREQLKEQIDDLSGKMELLEEELFESKTL